MFEQIALNTLLNDSTITALTSAYGTGKAIFFGHVLPKDLDDSATSINYYYESEGLRGGFKKFPWMVNCRASTEYEAATLQEAVFNVLNRYCSGNYYLCENIEVIPPTDETDNYNAPMRVIIKAR